MLSDNEFLPFSQGMCYNLYSQPRVHFCSVEREMIDDYVHEYKPGKSMANAYICRWMPVPVYRVGSEYANHYLRRRAAVQRISA